jgi:hypothetical protein
MEFVLSLLSSKFQEIITSTCAGGYNDLVNILWPSEAAVVAKDLVADV